MNRQKTKTKQVLEYLWAQGSITSAEAELLCGVSNITELIYRLRRHGVEIDKVRLKEKGNKCRWYLRKEQ